MIKRNNDLPFTDINNLFWSNTFHISYEFLTDRKFIVLNKLWVEQQSIFSVEIHNHNIFYIPLVGILITMDKLHDPSLIRLCFYIAEEDIISQNKTLRKYYPIDKVQAYCVRYLLDLAKVIKEEKISFHTKSFSNNQ